MFRTIVLLTSFCLLALPGCGGRTFGGPIQQDGGPPSDGIAPRPDGRAPDGSPVVCQEERHVELRQVPLDSLGPMHWAPLVEGQALRFTAWVSYGGCDGFAGVTWWTEDNGRTITVAGRIWKAIGEELICPGVIMSAEEIIVVPDLTPGTTLVRENTTQPNALSFVIEVMHCDSNQDCYCSQGGGQKVTGADCQFDCECQSGLLCLSHYGMMGPFSICGRNCSRDAQCPGGRPCQFTDDGAYGVCSDWAGPNECENNSDCRAGYSCIPGEVGGMYCRASFNPIGQENPCECDEQCGIGLHCIDLGTDAVPRCRAGCLGERDCPQGFFCAHGFGNVPPLCGIIDP